MVDPQSIHIAENAGVPTPATGQLHHKETVQQPAQKRPGTETGLYQEKHCRLGLKETMDKMKEGFWTSGILQDRTVELFHCEYALSRASQVALVVKNPPADAGDIRDVGLIPGLGRSHGNPLQYSCLENPMDRSLVGYSPEGCKELDMTEAT